jgi:hypothetical protein
MNSVDSPNFGPVCGIGLTNRIAAVSLLLAFVTAASAASDTSLVRAVTFALTGSDGTKVDALDASNCVFQVKSEKYFRDDRYTAVDIFYLNNVDPHRIAIQNRQQTEYSGQTSSFIDVDLYGEEAVWEGPTTLIFDPTLKGSLNPRRDSNGNLQFRMERRTHKSLELNTPEFDRYARAWKYIYADGCKGSKSSF